MNAIRGAALHAVPKAVRTSHNIHTRSVRHAVRDQWGSLADPVRVVTAARRQGRGSTPALSVPSLSTFAEAADSVRSARWADLQARRESTAASGEPRDTAA